MKLFVLAEVLCVAMLTGCVASSPQVNKINLSQTEATQRLNLCANQKIASIDDHVSDASTVAYALSAACFNDYATLTQTIAQTLDNDVQRREYNRRAFSPTVRTEMFIPFVMSYRASSTTEPVTAQFKSSDEMFLGQATGHTSGKGELTIQSGKGTSCTGDFKYASSTLGNGTFACSDGRHGMFTFTANGGNGSGFGRTSNGDELRFVFGPRGSTTVRNGLFE